MYSVSCSQLLKTILFCIVFVDFTIYSAYTFTSICVLTIERLIGFRTAGDSVHLYA